jgi:glycosyltransferase involved in cell wall biosynthesis
VTTRREGSRITTVEYDDGHSKVVGPSPTSASGIIRPVSPSFSVVIPAHNAERTLGAVLESILDQEPAPAEVIVVDDASSDRTGEIAAVAGATVLRNETPQLAGGARNRGWEAASGDVVVFLDSDAVPAPGWNAGIANALEQFSHALVGGARTFAGKSKWGWVAHLQVETPYLARGDARDVRFLSSYCLAVPRDAPLRWDESYGGEDGIFSAQALAAGYRLVFDPRFVAHHDHQRASFRDLRRQQNRLAYGLARIGGVQREGLHKRVLARVPLHYFALVRLLFIWRRVRSIPELRRPFLANLHRLVLAEWTLGADAVRYAVRRPPLHGQGDDSFR